jgi:hypothetical protein
MSGIISANMGASSGLVQAAAGIPSGVILMWHGDIADIPTGWVLCNGSNSTPDLRGRFVQGAADGDEANDPVPGGSSTAAPASHSDHSVTQPSTHAALASHAHKASFGTAYGSYFIYHQSAYGAGAAVTMAFRGVAQAGDTSSIATALTSSEAAGTPNAHSGSAVDAHSSHSTSDSRPPFYTILYIMKS